MSERETFAARWNRRKLEAKRDDAVAEPTDASAAGAIGEPEAEPIDERPLPTLDEITPEGSIAQFLEKRIPAELQKLALRKAWTSDPLISGFIEMAENQYDWNAPGGCPGYGPMDPSWNLEKLLAHATGALPAEPGPEAVEAAANAGSSSAECDKTTQPYVTPADGESDAVQGAAHNAPGTADDPIGQEPSSGSSEPSIQADNTQPGKAPFCDMHEETQRLAMHNIPANGRRRHGGALPRA